jgi:hypothetical protein
MNTIQRDFAKQVEDFLLRHKISARRFSVAAMSDAGFVSRLRAGNLAKTTTIERVQKYMQEHDAPAP